jgi:hypothetical protein
MGLIENQSSLAKVKPEYQRLLKELTNLVESHFGVDLRAYYLLGSVGRGEDLPGVSDIDTMIVLKRDVIDEDEVWEKGIKVEFEPKYPMLSLLDISCIEEKELNEPDAERLRFIFKSDGVLISGQDITSDFSSYPPGLELAKLLNHNYRETLAELRKDILEPDEEDKDNPNYVIEYVRWISKKVLRLCLGIVMVDEEFYTRNMQAIALRFSQLYPAYQLQVENTLNQYLKPTNNVEQALDFIDDMNSTIYQLADEKLL